MTPPSYIQIDNFLDLNTNQELLDFAIGQEHNFTNSTTSTNAIDWRKSRVLNILDKFQPIIDPLIRSSFVNVLTQLDLDPFEIDRIEAQITAHNDGHYYKTHNDNGHIEARNRVLTYVYYFNRTPKAFAGGELEIYTDLIAPANNTTIFFPSSSPHQVLPVRVPSGAFNDSRFTFNGWIRTV